MLDQICALELGAVQKHEFFAGYARTLTIRTETADVQLVLSAEEPTMLEFREKEEKKHGQWTDDTAADSRNGRGDAEGAAPAASHHDARPGDAGD